MSKMYCGNVLNIQFLLVYSSSSGSVPKLQKLRPYDAVLHAKRD